MSEVKSKINSCKQVSGRETRRGESCRCRVLSELSRRHAWRAPPLTRIQRGGGWSGVIVIGTAVALGLDDSLVGFIVDDARFHEHFVVVWSTCLLAGHAVPADTIAELQLRKRSELVEPLKRAVHELSRLWVDLIERQQAPAIRCDLQHRVPNELGLRLVDEVVEVDACPARLADVLVGVRVRV